MGRANRRVTAWSMVVLSAVSLAAPVAGAQTADPSALYERGFQLRQEHRDAEALEVFRQLFEATREPRVEAQMALAEGDLGRLVDAETHLADALGHRDDRWIRRNRVSLDAALATLRNRLGSIVVECPVPGAEVWLNGQRTAALPMTRPLRVVAGTVTYEVRASGYATLSRSVQVPTAPVLRERVELQPTPTPTPAPVAVAPPVVTPAPVVTSAIPERAVVEPTPVLAVREPEAAPPPGRGRRTLAWVGLGTSALLIAGGVTGMVLREAAAARYNGEYCAGDAVPPEGEPSDACRSDRAATGTMQTLGIVGLAAGGVLAVASVVLLVTAPSGRSERAAIAGLRCGGGPGAIGVACGGVF